MRLDVGSGSPGGRRSHDASPERPGTANSAAPTAASDHPSPRTVYSDVSHLKPDNVGYAIRMRDKRGSPGLEQAFLPKLEEGSRDGSRDGTDPYDNRSFTSLESMAGEFDGCPTDHPSCLAREERWVKLEELLEQRAEDLKEVEEAANDATKEVEGMRNETNFLIKQYGKKEEKWVEKSEANSLQRKELDELEQHATETVAAIEKAKAEVISFTLQLKDQEAAIAAKNRAGEFGRVGLRWVGSGRTIKRATATAVTVTLSPTWSEPPPLSAQYS